MNPRQMGALSERQPTIGYYLSMAAALVGFVCIAIAVVGTRRTLSGGDGLSALSGAGVPGLIVAWALAFYARLAFSQKLSGANQALVHASLRILMVFQIIAASAASWFVLRSTVASADLRAILIVADVLQVGTILWVLRYSRE